MNSYNENLHSSVVSSLNEQELELQKVKSKLDASVFSLYYAQSERITTAEKLEITNRKYTFEQKVHEQAITDSDLSTNVLASSKNVKTYTAKSVTNTAVAAANVQVAANAILKLASDTGSIFSIINAADFGTEIYTQSQTAYQLMNVTAYTAEQTSQHSMEASSLIAEVPSNTLANKATTTDASVKSLLNVTTAQFNATTQELASENTKLATANTNEKKAEGVLEDVSVAYNATFQAYRLNNNELNLDLRVIVPTTVGDRTNYTVSFLPYTSPFPQNGVNGTTHPAGYPVQDYYIMLVKDSKNDTFSINNAEDIVTKNDRNRFYQISPQTPIKPITLQKNQTRVNFSELDINSHISQKIYTSELLDTDGDAMNLGDSYVVVVFAVLTTGYKKIINTFDDYMTAPSQMFTLTNQLNKVSGENIHAIGGDAQEILTISDNLATGAIAVTDTKEIAVEKINFQVLEKPHYEVQYRCVFLPDNTDLVKGLLTVEGLVDIEKETKQLEEIADYYDPQISETKEQINSLIAEISGLEIQVEENTQIINDENTKAPQKKKLEKENTDLTATITSKKAELNTLQSNLETLESDQQAAIENLTKADHIKPGFFFNLITAEQIPAGSYTAIDKGEPVTEKALLSYLINEAKIDWKKVNWDEVDTQKLEKDLLNIIKDIKNLKLKKFIEDMKTLFNDALKIILEEIHKDFADFINDLTLLHDGYQLYAMEIDIKTDTTDNFGNRLIDNNKYIPTIVAITNSTVAVNKQFTNSLSDFQHTDTFKYVDPNPNATY